MKLPVIKLDASLHDSLSRGHPWVYRTHLRDEPNYDSGTWVEVRAGSWSAIGLWDDESAIAVRIFSRSQVPDARWVRALVRGAWTARAPLRAAAQPTTAYRWVFGENEGLPGITVDLYGAYAVVRSYARSLDVVIPWVVEALRQEAPLRGVLLRRFAGGDDEAVPGDEHAAPPAKVQLAWGEMPPADLVIEEHGLQFRADLVAGQKTGLFLDHRENRHLLESWSAGRTVLNCFAYTGAFGVYALRGGATAVTSCDVAPGAAADAALNLQLNGFDPAQHPFEVADCFELLSTYVNQRRTFDLVILDPPSFAHSRRQLPAALRAYGKLNALALRCVASGGLLASASCTSQVSPDAFREMLATSAQAAGRRLLIVHEAAQPLDHPVAAHFPEGRYLKFVLARVLPLL